MVEGKREWVAVGKDGRVKMTTEDDPNRIGAVLPLNAAPWPGVQVVRMEHEDGGMRRVALDHIYYEVSTD